MKREYLYDVELDYSDGKLRTIFSSPYDFELNLNYNQYSKDLDIFHQFNEMLFSDATIAFISESENFSINDFKILSKVDYSTSYNKLIPNNLFKSLAWFNKAVALYNDYSIDEVELFIEHIQKAYTEKIFRNLDSNILKETALCGYINESIKDKGKKIQHAEAILRSIMKEISISTIRNCDKATNEFLQSYPQKNEDMEQWEWEELCALKEIRIGSSYNLIFPPIINPTNIDDYRTNLLSHIGKLVAELGFMLSELIGSILGHSDDVYTDLYLERLEDILLKFKIRLIKEKKKYVIEHQAYSVSLEDLKNEKEENFANFDKDAILSVLVSSFKKKEKVQAILNDIDEHYYISKSVKFPKRKLAIIAYILQHCELFNKMSYETFKQNICWYYGKENISMKPNKIKNEALQEYYKKEFVYKKYDIVIK